jgi:hypothetical protein
VSEVLCTSSPPVISDKTNKYNRYFFICLFPFFKKEEKAADYTLPQSGSDQENWSFSIYRIMLPLAFLFEKEVKTADHPLPQSGSDQENWSFPIYRIMLPLAFRFEKRIEKLRIIHYHKVAVIRRIGLFLYTELCCHLRFVLKKK